MKFTTTGKGIMEEAFRTNARGEIIIRWSVVGVPEVDLKSWLEIIATITPSNTDQEGK